MRKVCMFFDIPACYWHITQMEALPTKIQMVVLCLQLNKHAHWKQLLMYSSLNTVSEHETQNYTRLAELYKFTLASLFAFT